MRKKYCMDCGDYREGGICGRDGKPTSALKEMCEDHAGNDVAMAEIKSEKQCVKCGRVLPIESFARSRRNNDGRQTWCRECSAKAYKKWYDKHLKDS